MKRLDEELNRLQQEMNTFNRNEERLNRLREQRKALMCQVGEFERQLEKEKIDVEHLKRTGVKTIFYQLLGSYETQLEQEEREVLQAQLKYAQAKSQLDHCEEQIQTFIDENATLRGASRRYEERFRQKYEWIRSSDSKIANDILTLEKELADKKRLLKELSEAIEAGWLVMESLNQTLSSLDHAKSCGVFDIVGGGIIASAAKHSYLDEARSYADAATRALGCFKIELQDIEVIANMKIDVGSIATFADFFFDGYLVDWFVQSQINQSADQIESVRQKVKQVLETLEETKKIVSSQSRITQEQLKDIILAAK